MSLNSTLSNIWTRFQGELFPELAEEIGPLMEKHKHLVQVLDLVEVERFAGTPPPIGAYAPPEIIAEERLRGAP